MKEFSKLFSCYFNNSLDVSMQLNEYLKNNSNIKVKHSNFFIKEHPFTQYLFVIFEEV